MLEKLILSDKELEKVKYLKLGHGHESNVYLYNDNGEKKAIKIFKNKRCIKNKISKIILIKERTKKLNFVVNFEKIVVNNNEVIGYSMPLICGNKFSFLDFNKYENIEILKEISKRVKKLHSLGIICGDLHGNILIDKNGNLNFIDIDNFSIDNFNVDVENIFLQTYKKTGKRLDKKFDNYQINLLTLSMITKIFMPALYNQYVVNPQYFYFKDEKINKIAKNTFNLQKNYDDELIIDHINSKKDMKKIKRKIF